jgi:hypothetical protein
MQQCPRELEYITGLRKSGFNHFIADSDGSIHLNRLSVKPAISANVFIKIILLIGLNFYNFTLKTENEVILQE